MSAVLPKTVRGRVVFLVVLAFLPAVVLTWYGHREITVLANEATEQELLRLADVTGSDFEGMLDEGRAMLFALAQIDEIGRARRPACDQLLGQVLEASPRYTALAVIDPEGYRVCGAVALENPLYLGDRSYVLRAIGSREFSVGDYQIGRITGRAGVGLAQPIYDEDGALLSVLATTLDLTRLAQHASGAQLPANATYTLSDLSGNVLLRYPESSEWLGRALPESFPAGVSGDDEATQILDGQDLDGTTRRFSVSRLVRPGGLSIGYLTVGIPISSATARLNTILGNQLSILAISAVLLLLAAWGLGHFSILNRATAIIDAEHRIADGDLTARTGVEYDRDEFGELARGFDDMAARLEERDHRDHQHGEPAGMG